MRDKGSGSRDPDPNPSHGHMRKSVIVAAPTPFDRAGAVDLDGLRHNIAKWLEAGLDGVLVLGSTGEAGHLDDEEGIAIVAAAREVVPRDRMLMVGTGRQSTAATVGFTARAAAAGADVALVVTPNYYRPELTREAYERYYRRVADDAEVPIYLYSVPQFTGVTLAPDLAVELAAHPRVIGMKESSGDAATVFDIVSRTDPGFAVFNGSARAVYPSLASGAAGSILAVACAAPELAVSAHKAFQEGDIDGSRTAAVRFARLASRLAPFGLGGLKAAMALRGYRGGEPRHPLVFDESNRARIEAILLETLGEPEPY
jgi:4-hydroxy-2-oxoglutarate aldolase